MSVFCWTTVAEASYEEDLGASIWVGVVVGAFEAATFSFLSKLS